MEFETRLKELESRIAALEAATHLSPAPIVPDAQTLYSLPTIIEAGWLGSSTTAYKLVQRREVPSVALGPHGGCLRVRGQDILDYHASKTTRLKARARKFSHIQ